MRACVYIYKKNMAPKEMLQGRRLVCANGDGREGEWCFRKEGSQEEREEQPPPKYPPEEALCR